MRVVRDVWARRNGRGGPEQQPFFPPGAGDGGGDDDGALNVSLRIGDSSNRYPQTMIHRLLTLRRMQRNQRLVHLVSSKLGDQASGLELGQALKSALLQAMLMAITETIRRSGTTTTHLSTTRTTTPSPPALALLVLPAVITRHHSPLPDTRARDLVEVVADSCNLDITLVEIVFITLQTTRTAGQGRTEARRNRWRALTVCPCSGHLEGLEVAVVCKYPTPGGRI